MIAAVSTVPGIPTAGRSRKVAPSAPAAAPTPRKGQLLTQHSGLPPRALNQEDVSTAGLESINVATSGILEPVEGAKTQFLPLLQSSEYAMPFEAARFAMLNNPEELLRDLRELGRNLSAGRFPDLRSRGWHAQLCRAIEDGLPRSDDGRLLLTFEVIYGHAFKAPPRIPVASSTQVAVDDLRAMLRAPRR